MMLLATRIAFAGSVIPKVESERAESGHFSLTTKSALVYAPEARGVAMYLLEYLPFKQILSSSKAMPGDLLLGINPRMAAEQYRLTIDRHNIRIVGGSYGGLFNGVQTLLQMLPPEVYGKRARLPLEVACCDILDAPAYNYRGFMLDVARTWIPADRVKRYIDLLAYHKFNKLHFHLTDDEGWRIELKSHPEFATIGGFRGGDSPVHPRYAKFDEKWGGYYTQEQLRDIVAYAAARNIEVIPEIDMPGHSKALGAIHPDILCNYTPDTSTTNGLDIRNVWCAAKPSNYALIEDIIRELSTIFTSEYIHIGGDEVSMSQWRKCPDCQRLKEEKGLKNEAQIEDYFIAEVTNILAKYGKKPAVWNEGIEGGLLPKTTRVYGWQSIKKCREATNAGYPTIVMPGQYFYMDMKQSPYEEGHNWAAIFDAKQTLSFDLAKQGMSQSEIAKVAGIEASFFSEIYIANNPESNDYLDYMLFPRLCSVAEIAWCGERKRSWEEFYKVLTTNHYDRMCNMGIAFRLQTPRVEYADGTLSATVDDGSTLYYKDERTGRTSRYTKPLTCSDSRHIVFRSQYGTAHSRWAGSNEYHKMLTPPVVVTTSMPVSQRSPLENVAKYTNATARTTRAAHKGDWIEYRFTKPLSCQEIIAQTGHIHLRRNLLLSGYVEVSYDGKCFERTAELVDGGAVLRPTKPLHALRIVATDRSDA
ncbi:MAG: beta-N-acetylhexosaminidase [Alistipes sp.]|nr:beta-N-acetylhexosaminidase [Alistipes sp.]